MLLTISDIIIILKLSRSGTATKKKNNDKSLRKLKHD